MGKELSSKLNSEKLKQIFYAIVLTLSCLTMNSDKLSGYCQSKGPVHITIRFVLIFFFVFIATLINKASINEISKINSVIILTITALLIVDYYTLQISGSQFLFRVWWIGAIFVAEASTFLSTATIKPKEFEDFSRRFWLSFTPIYVFLLFLCFARAPFAKVDSVNFTLGQGTFLMLKAYLNSPFHDFEPPLIFFGNLLVFVPMPFIIKTVFKSINSRWMLAIGGIIPPFIEAYQMFFECGDTDIDDIVLNWAGFLIGFVIFRIIYAKKEG